ncbi:hypothetical protein ABPG74_014882 [Tetrahymena malaccensis]
MQEAIQLGQRRGSSSETKSAFQPSGISQVQQMYQKYNEIPIAVGRPQITPEQQQHQQMYLQQQQVLQINNQLLANNNNLMRGIEKNQAQPIGSYNENRTLSEGGDNLYKNNQYYQSQDIINDQCIQQQQYPFSCIGTLRQEENPNDLFAEALLVGPYHVIVLASQMKKLIVTSDQNITKRLYFQYLGKEINVKDFFLNSSSQYAIALLEQDIGAEYGYLGIINAKIDYFINMIQKQKGVGESCIINMNRPSQKYEINDISFKQLKINLLNNVQESDSLQQNYLTSQQNMTKGWYIIKDEQLGYCIIGYSQNSTIPFINTMQIERWMSSSDETVQADNFSFVASTKMDIKDLTDNSISKAHSSGIYKICRINHEIAVSSSCDNSIKFWDPITKSLIKNYQNDQCCRNFCISEDQQYLFGTCDNYIFRMKWKSNYQIDKAFSCQDKIYSICKIKIDEKTGHDIIAAGDALGNIYVIDATQMQQIQIIHNSNTNKNGHVSSLNSICKISNNQIATAGGGGQLKIWMWEDGFLVKNLEGHNTQKNIYFVDKHPEKENQLITASSDQTIRVWDISTGQQVKKILVNNSIYCAGFLNEYELAVGDFNLIRIFNLRTWQYKKIDKHTCRINTICSLNERSFVSGDIEGNIYLFSFEDETKNQEILIEGIQGDSKVQNNQSSQFNKTYKIVYPNYQNFGEVSRFRQHTDAIELSFERLENQSVKNPESAQKSANEYKQAIPNKPLQANQDMLNQKNQIQNHSFGQQPVKIQKQQENPVTISTPLKQAAMVDRTRQNSVHLIQMIPQQNSAAKQNRDQEGIQDILENQNPVTALSGIKQNQDSNQKNNFSSIQDSQNFSKVNNNYNNGNFISSEKKDFSYNYKNPYQDSINNGSNNNSFMNVPNSNSQSEKKIDRKNSFEMENIKKDNPQEINSFINAQGIKNPVNVSQSSAANLQKIGSPVNLQFQQNQVQLQQYKVQQNNMNPSNPFERKRSNSVVKVSLNQNIDEQFLACQQYLPLQNNSNQNQIYQPPNNSNNNNNNNQQMNLNNQSLNQITNQYGGRVIVVPRSSSAAKLSAQNQQQQNNSIPNNINQVSAQNQLGSNPYSSPNSIQQVMINNIIYQKLNQNNSNVVNSPFNPMMQNQMKQAQANQINYLQQAITPTQQTNSSAQKDIQSPQIYTNPNNNSNENLHKLSQYNQNNPRESFGSKVRSFTRTPEKTPISQSLAPSPIPQIQQQPNIVSNQVNSQYKPQILRERNQGNSIDLGNHNNNQSFKNENDDNALYQKDNKMRQTYENHIQHLKSEIQKLEQSCDSKNEMISLLTKEKTEMFELINQLKKELELSKLNQDKENKSKYEIMQCSNKLSEISLLNEELIKKITHYQEQEKKNQQILSDLINSNSLLNEKSEQQQKESSELESLVFQLKQQIQERDQHISMQQNRIQDLDNQNNILTQKLEVSQRYNEEEVQNLQKQLAEKERYISSILKGQSSYGLQSLNEQQKQSKAISKYFSEKESISEINPYETENNRTNTYQEQDSLLFKVEKDEEKSSAKFQSNSNNDPEVTNKDLKDKYKKIEIMASLRSAQDECINLKSQIQKLRQEYGDQVELTDKYNQLNESFKQKSREVDNWRKIYNEIYEKQ